MSSSKEGGSETQKTLALNSNTSSIHIRSESDSPTMMAAMKIAFLLAVAVLAFLMVTDARRLLDYDDCHRGACFYVLAKPQHNAVSLQTLPAAPAAILGHKRPFL